MMKRANESGLMSAGEVMEHTGLNRSEIKHLAKHGLFPTPKVNKQRYFWARIDIEAWMDCQLSWPDQ